MKSPYDPRVGDLWGLGSVLYAMVVGRLPFGRIKDENEARSLRPLQFPEAHVLVLTREVKDLLRGMLAYVPSARFVCLFVSLLNERLADCGEPYQDGAA